MCTQACWEEGLPKSLDSDPGFLGLPEDSQLPPNPSGSESCCFTVGGHIPDST